MPSNTSANFRYSRLADDLESKIRDGIYRSGEKMPSLRKLHDQTGLSITTVYQAYIELEKRGVVAPKQKSGYYVKPLMDSILPPPEAQKLHPEPKKVTVNALAYTIVEDMGSPEFLQLGGSTVMPELLPFKQLTRCLRSTTMEAMKRSLMRYEDPYGNAELKRQIAKRMIGQTRQAVLDEMVITSGCIEAVNLCLRAIGDSGDTIVVESPTYPWFLQIIEDQNKFALEMPTDPQTGIDLDQLERALAKNAVAACLLVPNFHNPLGFLMPEEKKKKLVRMMAARQIPIIEDNIHGELYFGGQRPSTLKSYDRKGLVLHCGSFSKTLSPGLRVGWALPGRYAKRVRRLKMDSTVASPTLNQQLVAQFLKEDAFDRHLRRLRTALKNQITNMALAIARYFPEGTRITAPQGGLTLWVELDRRVDGLKVFHEARKQKISIFPGAICSTTANYGNCIRINCGYPWSEKIEAGVRTLAGIIAGQCRR
ncbi:GntR family transcriptional regulator [Desulfosarcina ovata subsp. sediminis]|uniref:GntR family transcriptional regulator n=1 Tax=Desulfosarcina ovata subsp. sediminis TaxID=885957 RepID=A0A5K7ZTU0_9BACT|nr:PLP-dependent aminotransferase family protein [Desulfosarcina ovata]BBO83635.1 GntR family transcriptional regulator [Desulfosarcina ovata subsp. sediminis]